jgi:hypothetical protein
MLERHPRSASGRSGCSLSRFSLGDPPFPVLARAGISGARANDGRRVLTAGAQGPGIGVVGEDDAAGAEPVDQGRRIARRGDGHAAFPVCRIVTDEKDGEGGQVRQDLVLTDVGVLRPVRVGDGGAGVAVAAPVRGPAIGPAGFEPAPRTARTR